MGMAENSRPITVVLADDHAMFREGLALAISEDERLHLVGEASSGPEALRLIQEHDPDVALLDVQMPELDGLALCERLGQDDPPARTQVVILSAFDDRAFVDRAHQAGCAAYLSKNASRDEICAKLVEVAASAPQRTPS